MLSDIDIALRLLVACIFGGVIGYERQSRRKSAGFRTHVLVCLGSCLIMTLSMNMYYSVQGNTNADPARLAAQVVSGIGFIGAGTIIKEGLTVRGLTTAASLWTVSGVGLTVGFGYFVSASIATLLAFITLTALTRLEARIACCNNFHLFIITVDMPGQIGKITSCIGHKGFSITDITVEDKPECKVALSLLIDPLGKNDRSELIEQLRKLPGITSVEIN